MRLFTLSPRLSAAAAYLPSGTKLADIGCDHGRLPIYCAKNLALSRIIACDLRPVPLSHARENCALYEVEDKIELRLGDGLAPVSPEECTHITILGMGGDTIAAILSRAPWTMKGEHTLILQPESSAHRLRAFLYESGYRILDERAVQDTNRVYTILCVRGGGEKIEASLLDEFASPSLREKHDEDARRYLARVYSALGARMKGQAEGSEAYRALESARKELEDEYGKSLAD